MSAENKSYRVQIIVAIIGLVGVLGAAIIPVLLVRRDDDGPIPPKPNKIELENGMELAKPNKIELDGMELAKPNKIELDGMELGSGDRIKLKFRDGRFLERYATFDPGGGILQSALVAYRRESNGQCVFTVKVVDPDKDEIQLVADNGKYCALSCCYPIEQLDNGSFDNAYFVSVEKSVPDENCSFFIEYKGVFGGVKEVALLATTPNSKKRLLLRGFCCYQNRAAEPFWVIIAHETRFHNDEPQVNRFLIELLASKSLE